MDLFYLPDLKENAEVVFSSEESRHLAKVLRKKPGDIIRATNGNGEEHKIELKTIDVRKSRGQSIQVFHSPASAHRLHIAVAPTKNINRFEWFLEKATEIGISEITPLLCDHSERKTIKNERLEKIVIAALKQSQRNYLPVLHPLTSFEDFLQQHPKGYIAHCSKGEKSPLANLTISAPQTTLLIGPEGDFSPKEIRLAKENNYTEISLGEFRLRTETAAIVACTTLALKTATR